MSWCHPTGTVVHKFLCLTALCVLLVPCASAGVIYIQPIQVCADDSTGCANSAQTLFEAEGDKIWAQAGLDLSFYSWNTYSETDYLSIADDAEFFALLGGAGHGQNADATVINMWFVDVLYPGGGGTTFGVSVMPGNAIAISNAVFTYTRLDTIAHEIGHSLGLDHYTGADKALNLMAAGTDRTVPTTIGDIYPDGADLDQLNSVQITAIAESDLIHDDPIPEPVSTVLVGAGLVGLVFLRRTR